MYVDVLKGSRVFRAERWQLTAACAWRFWNVFSGFSCQDADTSELFIAVPLRNSLPRASHLPLCVFNSLWRLHSLRRRRLWWFSVFSGTVERPKGFYGGVDTTEHGESQAGCYYIFDDRMASVQRSGESRPRIEHFGVRFGRLRVAVQFYHTFSSFVTYKTFFWKKIQPDGRKKLIFIC